MSTLTARRSLIFLLSIGFMWSFPALSEPTEPGKAAPNQGLTIENIGRGLKSAAKNIEEEIPKIGPAISETFKKTTTKEKDQSKSPSHNSGPSKK
jgi:hypothetical protein